MNYVGLFEGISGFGLAFKRAGAKIKAVCEINADCQKVLRRHHPEAELISDVKAITKDTFNGEPITILAGGFPCQDLSVAGLRKGLDGERSGLWFEFIRIIADHQPRWVVIENVPGLMSSNNGRDLTVILDGLEELGYVCDVDILDAQYFGVPQRRRRVFIVCQQVNHLLQSKTISSALTIAQCLIENSLLVLAEARAPLSLNLETSTFDVGRPLLSLKQRMKLFGMQEDGQAQTLRENLAVIPLSLDKELDDLVSHLGSNFQEDLKNFEGTRLPRSQKQTVSIEEKQSTEMLWSDILDECLLTMSECITSTDASAITESKIFTCAQLMLSIAKLIILSPTSCPAFWSAGSSALTALQGFTNYARQTSNSLFTESSWIQPWGDFIAEAEQTGDSLRSIGAECGEQVFPLPNGSAWDSPPRREAGSRTAETLTANANQTCGFPGDIVEQEIAGTLRSNGDAHSGFEFADGLVPAIAATLNSGGNTGGFRTEPGEHLVAFNWQAGGNQTTLGADPDKTSCLHVGQVTAIAFAQNTRDEVRYINGDGQIAGALAAEAGMKQQSYVMAMQINANDEVRSSDIAYTLNTNGDATGRNSPTIAGQFGVRRLTPTECERLQGFPEVENAAIIEICLDFLKSLVNAESQSPKLPKPAGNAERINQNQSAKSAALNTRPSYPSDSKPAQNDVHIFCGASGVEIRSQERSFWFASNAGKASWCLPSISPEDFVRLSVLINSTAAQITQDGKAESHPSGTCSISQRNGVPLVRLSGSAMMPLVSDASEDLTTQSRPTKSTTSSPSSAPSLEQQLITSCCSVVSAISGFIPLKTQTGNSFRIEVRTKFGWTAFGDDGKPISDSARYRMLGNAVCVPTVEWIARRIAEQEAAS